jgi:hypothetical protein
MTRILHDRIQSLHLNPESPFPSEIHDGHELVLQWRRRNRLRLLDNHHRDADSDADCLVDDGEVE